MTEKISNFRVFRCKNHEKNLVISQFKTIALASTGCVLYGSDKFLRPTVALSWVQDIFPHQFYGVKMPATINEATVAL